MTTFNNNEFQAPSRLDERRLQRVFPHQRHVHTPGAAPGAEGQRRRRSRSGLLQQVN